MTRISTPRVFIVVASLLIIASAVFGFTRWQKLQDKQPEIVSEDGTTGGITREVEVPVPTDTGPSGITAEEAGRIVPIGQIISLTAEATPQGVLLQWTPTRPFPGDYYEVYRVTMTDIGRELKVDEEGNLIPDIVARIEIETNHSGPYQYIDTSPGVGIRYIYTVGNVSIETISNLIDITWQPDADN